MTGPIDYISIMCTKLLAGHSFLKPFNRNIHSNPEIYMTHIDIIYLYQTVIYNLYQMIYQYVITLFGTEMITF